MMARRSWRMFIMRGKISQMIISKRKKLLRWLIKYESTKDWGHFILGEEAKKIIREL
jgi:hypothetical protein